MRTLCLHSRRQRTTRRAVLRSPLPRLSARGRQRRLEECQPAEVQQDQVWRKKRPLCQHSRRQLATRRAVLRRLPPRLASRSVVMLL
jgi:hypothetical protein